MMDIENSAYTFELHEIWMTSRLFLRDSGRCCHSIGCCCCCLISDWLESNKSMTKDISAVITPSLVFKHNVYFMTHGFQSHEILIVWITMKTFRRLCIGLWAAITRFLTTFDADSLFNFLYHRQYETHTLHTFLLNIAVNSRSEIEL